MTGSHKTFCHSKAPLNRSGLGKRCRVGPLKALVLMVVVRNKLRIWDSKSPLCHPGKEEPRDCSQAIHPALESTELFLAYVTYSHARSASRMPCTTDEAEYSTA